MRINSITNYSNAKSTPNFKADLWVHKSDIESVIYSNKDAFEKAVDRYEKWLKNDMWDVNKFN